MAITVPKITDQMVIALVKAFNSLQDATLVDGYHRNLTQLTSGDFETVGGITLTTLTVTADDATGLDDGYVLANNIQGVLSVHMRDDQAHLIVDSDNLAIVDGYEPADSATSLYSLLNGCKAAFNLHRVASGVHLNDDSGNVVTAADATDTSSAVTLANEMKQMVNLHVQGVGTSGSVPRINVILP